MASFASCTFLERSAGEGYPTWGKKDLFVIKTLPNNDPVTQEIGMDVQRLALAVQCSAVELAALYDQVLESGSLIMAWETHDAFLESVESVLQVSIGLDTYWAVLNLVRL